MNRRESVHGSACRRNAAGVSTEVVRLLYSFAFFGDDAFEVADCNVGAVEQARARCERIDAAFDKFARFFVVSDHDVADEDHRDVAGFNFLCRGRRDYRQQRREQGC